MSVALTFLIGSLVSGILIAGREYEEPIDDRPATNTASEYTPATNETPRLSAAATAEPSQSTLLFVDVLNDYWAKPYIDALSDRGLISGYEDGTFRPEAPLARAQVANIISRVFDLTTDKAEPEFLDVGSDYWARESIGEVVNGGFMDGFPDDTFAPNIEVTRLQLLVTLVVGLEIEPPTDIQASLERYTDAKDIPDWAIEKIAAATSAGLVVNYPNVEKLNPYQPVTRAELAAAIYQVLERKGAVEPIDSEYLVKP